jgi:hypothetical protein
MQISIHASGSFWADAARFGIGRAFAGADAKGER